MPSNNTPYQITEKLGQLPRLTVSYSQKINLGNYESKDLFVSFSKDLPDNFDENALYVGIEEIYNNLKSSIQPIEKEIRGQTNDNKYTWY